MVSNALDDRPTGRVFAEKCVSESHVCMLLRKSYEWLDPC